MLTKQEIEAIAKAVAQELTPKALFSVTEAAPDIVYSWGGEGASKRHGNNVMWGFTGRQYGRNWDTGRFELEDSFVERLEKAGFDISTLRFSISVKPTPEQPSA